MPSTASSVTGAGVLALAGGVDVMLGTNALMIGEKLRRVESPF
jgi:hypothetical protein